uniref:Predicted protein n=1 Tax=Hordeum vulgare subsp. vulgare TaxID=112509 RepID=F2CTR6_HORVV|nr:predicted protein [Hordeum vulgare subsp. vulgare]
MTNEAAYLYSAAAAATGTVLCRVMIEFRSLSDDGCSTLRWLIDI